MNLPMLSLPHRRTWLLASVVILALVVAGSLCGSMPLPAASGFDKVEHFGAYLFLAVWFTGLYPRERYWAVALSLVGLGLLLELLQYSMQLGRTAEPLDMAANTVGVAAGVALGLMLTGNWAQKVESWLSRR